MEQIDLKNIMIAIDGSECSKRAFNMALKFFETTNLFQQIIVTHISNKEKYYLPLVQSPEFIYDEYKTELLSLFPSDKFALVFEEKEQEEPDCRSQILKIAAQMNVSFLFVGYSGRKGEKPEDGTVMSQTVKHCAFHSMVPLIITKRFITRDMYKTGGFTFLACVDGSKKSYRAMWTAFTLATHPKDQVLICFAPSPDKSNYVLTLKAEVEEQLEETTKVPWEFLVMPTSYDSSLQIIEFVNYGENYNVNFIVMGNNGYRAQIEDRTFFGRHAEKLLLRAKSNLIIIS